MCFLLLRRYSFNSVCCKYPCGAHQAHEDPYPKLRYMKTIFSNVTLIRKSTSSYLLTEIAEKKHTMTLLHFSGQSKYPCTHILKHFSRRQTMHKNRSKIESASCKLRPCVFNSYDSRRSLPLILLDFFQRIDLHITQFVQIHLCNLGFTGVEMCICES